MHISRWMIWSLSLGAVTGITLRRIKQTLLWSGKTAPRAERDESEPLFIG